MLGPRKVILLGKRLNPLWPLHNLPALQAWYTADDPAFLRQNSDGTGAVTADGDPVGYRMDRSGNARHVIQATTAAKLTWKVNIRKGRAVLRYDGGDSLANAAPGALLRNVPGATVVAVVQSIVKSSAQTLVYVRTLTSVARLVLERESSGTATVQVGGRRLDADGFQFITSANNVYAAGSWGVNSARAVYSDADIYLYHGTALVASSTTFQTAGSTSDTDAEAVVLGAITGGLRALTGDEAEIIICGADIGLPLLTRLWNEYLRPKWGVP